MIAVPTRGMVTAATATRLQEIRDQNPGLPPIMYVEGNLSVAQTRNKAVKAFMKTKCKVLAMVDDDIVPGPKFLELAKHLDKYAMIAQPHPTVVDGHIDFTIYMKNGKGHYFTPMKFGVHEVDAVATGAFLVRRDVLEELGPAPFRIDDDPDAKVTSDDLLFCQDLRDRGYRIGYGFLSGWFADHWRQVSLGRMVEAYRRP